MARTRKSNKGNTSVDSTVIVDPVIVPETVKPINPSAELKARRWYQANTFNLTPWENLTPEYRDKLISRYASN